VPSRKIYSSNKLNSGNVLVTIVTIVTIRRGRLHETACRGVEAGTEMRSHDPDSCFLSQVIRTATKIIGSYDPATTPRDVVTRSGCELYHRNLFKRRDVT